MTERYEFEGSEVLALLEESQAAAERLYTEAQRYVAAGVDLEAEEGAWEGEPEHPRTGAPPGLWLVNDRGVYLRSNAADRAGAQLAHARGYRADVQVGDEPICEFIDAGPLQQLRPTDVLVIAVSERRIRLSILRET